MKIIHSHQFDPYYNLALEEILLRDDNNQDDILLIYQNANAIIIGRNQIGHNEINDVFVKNHGIKVARRVSGGGAVYHDQGNVNFSFITTKEARSFDRFLAPIIAFLQSLGLNAQLRGKNDLVVGNMKISGNAQYIYQTRMFHHGTLLFDTDLTILKQALRVNALKAQSKATQSQPSGVVNICSLLKQPLTTPEFIELLKDFFVKHYQGDLFELGDYKKHEIRQLQSVRQSYDWNYVKNPPFNLYFARRLTGGTIEVHIDVQNNVIANISFSGDFLSSNDFENIYSFLRNQPYELDIIAKILQTLPNFSHYFGKIEQQEVLNLMFNH